MPKVKAKRQSVSLDMTAMCDVAFLLLTFFMLTAKFKPEEVVTIVPPSSVSETKLQGAKGLITLSVSKDGAIYMTTDDANTKREILTRMAGRYNIPLTGEMIKNYNASEVIGYPAGALSQVLSLKPADAKKNGLLKGIPCDSTAEGNELFMWISYAKHANKDLKVAIKGDAESNYKAFNSIVQTLVMQKINSFQLITSPEARPKI